MSSQLKERQQQDSKRHLDADSLLNKHIFSTLAYTFGGYAAGMATSLLFKRKAGIPLLMAGAGAGYGLSNLYGDMDKLKKFQSQGQSNTLKRDDTLGTKDWEKYQTKEEGQHNAKGSRYGGSDDSDDKDKSGKTEQKKTQKKDEGKGGEKSKQGVDSQKDQDKLANIEGKAYKGNGDSKGKHDDSKSKDKDSKSKHDDSKSKGKDSKDKESGSKKQDSTTFENRTSTQRQLNPNYIGTNPKNEAVTSGKSSGGLIQSQHYVEGHAKGGGNAPGEYREGTSEKNRRGGDNTKKVNEQLANQRASEQDRMGSSVKTGATIQANALDENVAGGQFRGGSRAGSQVNAVLE